MDVTDQVPFAIPSTLTMLVRGLRKRCPRCGRGRVFGSYFKMNKRCDSCSLAFEREAAHFVGAMAINIAVTELLFGVLLVTWTILSWPHPPWVWMTIGAAALNIIVPIAFYPQSKSVWTAVDLIMHTFDPIDRARIELP